MYQRRKWLPWLDMYINADQRTPQGEFVHVLKHLEGPLTDGTEIKQVSDGDLWIRGIFTKDALHNFAQQSEDCTPVNWNRARLILKKFSLHHLFHDQCSRCEFVLVVENFAVWSLEMGFYLKQSPLYCMENPDVQTKSQQLYHRAKEMQETQCTSMSEPSQCSVGSASLSELLRQMGQDSVSQQGPALASSQDPQPGCSHLQGFTGGAMHGLGAGPGTLAEDSLDVTDFLISAQQAALLAAIPEWKPGFLEPSTFQRSVEQRIAREQRPRSSAEAPKNWAAQSTLEHPSHCAEKELELSCEDEQTSSPSSGTSRSTEGQGRVTAQECDLLGQQAQLESPSDRSDTKRDDPHEIAVGKTTPNTFCSIAVSPKIVSVQVDGFREEWGASVEEISPPMFSPENDMTGEDKECDEVILSQGSVRRYLGLTDLTNEAAVFTGGKITPATESARKPSRKSTEANIINEVSQDSSFHESLLNTQPGDNNMSRTSSKLQYSLLDTPENTSPESMSAVVKPSDRSIKLSVDQDEEVIVDDVKSTEICSGSRTGHREMIHGSPMADSETPVGEGWPVPPETTLHGSPDAMTTVVVPARSCVSANPSLVYCSEVQSPRPETPGRPTLPTSPGSGRDCISSGTSAVVSPHIVNVACQTSQPAASGCEQATHSVQVGDSLANMPSLSQLGSEVEQEEGSPRENTEAGAGRRVSSTPVVKRPREQRLEGSPNQDQMDVFGHAPADVVAISGHGIKSTVMSPDAAVCVHSTQVDHLTHSQVTRPNLSFSPVRCSPDTLRQNSSLKEPGNVASAIDFNLDSPSATRDFEVTPKFKVAGGASGLSTAIGSSTKKVVVETLSKDDDKDHTSAGTGEGMPKMSSNLSMEDMEATIAYMQKRIEERWLALSTPLKKPAGRLNNESLTGSTPQAPDQIDAEMESAENRGDNSVIVLYSQEEHVVEGLQNHDEETSAVEGKEATDMAVVNDVDDAIIVLSSQEENKEDTRTKGGNSSAEKDEEKESVKEMETSDDVARTELDASAAQRGTRDKVSAGGNGLKKAERSKCQTPKKRRPSSAARSSQKPKALEECFPDMAGSAKKTKRDSGVLFNKGSLSKKGRLGGKRALYKDSMLLTVEESTEESQDDRASALDPMERSEDQRNIKTAADKQEVPTKRKERFCKNLDVDLDNVLPEGESQKYSFRNRNSTRKTLYVENSDESQSDDCNKDHNASEKKSKPKLPREVVQTPDAVTSKAGLSTERNASPAVTTKKNPVVRTVKGNNGGQPRASPRIILNRCPDILRQVCPNTRRSTPTPPRKPRLATESPPISPSNTLEPRRRRSRSSPSCSPAVEPLHSRGQHSRGDCIDLLASVSPPSISLAPYQQPRLTPEPTQKSNISSDTSLGGLLPRRRKDTQVSMEEDDAEERRRVADYERLVRADWTEDQRRACADTFPEEVLIFAAEYFSKSKR